MEMQIELFYAMKKQYNRWRSNYSALATRWKNKKMLKGGVGTLMSNYGLEKYFKKQGIKFVRANVGDRYVKEKMQKKFNLGGEQSGHIILGKFAYR